MSIKDYFIEIFKKQIFENIDNNKNNELIQKVQKIYFYFSWYDPFRGKKSMLYNKDILISNSVKYHIYLGFMLHKNIIKVLAHTKTYNFKKIDNNITVIFKMENYWIKTENCQIVSNNTLEGQDLIIIHKIKGDHTKEMFPLENIITVKLLLLFKTLNILTDENTRLYLNYKYLSKCYYG